MSNVVAWDWKTGADHHVIVPLDLPTGTVIKRTDFERDPYALGLLAYIVTAAQLRTFGGEFRRGGNKAAADELKRAAWAAERGKRVAMWVPARKVIYQVGEPEDKTLVEHAFEHWTKGNRDIARACLVDFLRDGSHRIDELIEALKRQPEGFGADMGELFIDKDGRMRMRIKPTRSTMS